MTTAETDAVNAMVLAIICAATGCCMETVGWEASFYDDLGLDSLSFAGLVMDVERRLEINIPYEDVGQLVTVGNLINYAVAQKEKSNA